MATKKYNGAPFGTQTSRFDISGVHPQSKMPGTFTQVPYCKKSEMNCKLGPGTYEVELGDFDQKNVSDRAKGPGWKKSYESAQLSALPHMLYREEWEQKRLLQERRGPGMYSTRDFVDVLNARPSSKLGVCSTRVPRFRAESQFRDSLPGPGSYGKGGEPTKILEERHAQSPGTVGMLSNGGMNLRKLPTTGCHLSPGCYNQKSSINELLKHSVSKRGPYDLFTGERDKGIKSENRDLGPGKYELGSFLDKWSDGYHDKYGKLSQAAQYPEVPSERIFCATLSQWPRPKNAPGPGEYNLSKRPISAPNPNGAPFGVSVERADKRSQRFFLGNTNPVGAGQYFLDKWEKCQHRNGCQSVFDSQTPRLPPNVDSPKERLLRERIRAKSVPERSKHFQIPVEAPC